MAEKPILATMTGEFFQPVRLHYRVLSREGVLRAFKRLRCVDRDPTRERWVWLYDHEACNLSFKVPCQQIPRHLHPIIIGSFFLRGKGELLLDVRSFERATLAVEFFDKHLPRKAAKLSEAEIVNRLFSTEDSHVTPDQIFDRQASIAPDPDAAVKGMIELTAHLADPQEKLRIAAEYMEAQAKQPLPEIERVPIHFYEEGIQSFTTSSKLRQIVAMQHWLGNTGYSMFDILQSMSKSV
jgi:hypothetical protein